jgi:hypothetical protein
MAAVGRGGIMVVVERFWSQDGYGLSKMKFSFTPA